VFTKTFKETITMQKTPTLDIIEKEATTDMSLSIYNIKDRALSEPGIRIKWLRNQIEIERKIKDLKSSIESEITSRVDSIIESNKQTTIPRALLIQRVSKEIKSTSRQQLVEFEEILYFIHNINKILDGFNFTIRNAIEAAKIEQQLR
jgi:hypothetical protein